MVGERNEFKIERRIIICKEHLSLQMIILIGIRSPAYCKADENIEAIVVSELPCAAHQVSKANDMLFLVRIPTK